MVAKYLFSQKPVAARKIRQRRDAAAAGEDQLGRFLAGHSKYYRLYLLRGKLTLAAMYLRRVRVVGRSSAAALKQVFTVATPPAPAAENFNVPGGKGVAACLRRWLAWPLRIVPARPAAFDAHIFATINIVLVLSYTSMLWGRNHAARTTQKITRVAVGLEHECR
jgi:hypothetical protein